MSCPIKRGWKSPVYIGQIGTALQRRMSGTTVFLLKCNSIPSKPYAYDPRTPSNVSKISSPDTALPYQHLPDVPPKEDPMHPTAPPKNPTYLFPVPAPTFPLSTGTAASNPSQTPLKAFTNQLLNLS